MLQRIATRRWCHCLAVSAAILLLLGGAWAPAAAASPAHIPTPIADPQGTLRTDGTYAVWTRVDEVSHVTSIAAVDLRDGRLIPVADALSRFTPPAGLADGAVVWHDQPADASRPARIRAMNLATGQAVDVSTPGAPLRSLGQPAVGGGWVVWAEQPSPDVPHRLMGRDIRSMTPPVPLVADFVGQALQMSGRRVVWAEGNAGDDQSTPWQVRSLVIGGGPPVTVAVITSTILPLLAISDDIVATRVHGYAGGQVVTIVEAIDLRTSARTALGRTGPVARSILATDGRLIVWNEVDNLDDAVIVARMADLATASLFVPTAPVEALAAGTAVWYEAGPPRPGVVPGLYIASVAMLLPSARRLAPAATSPDLTFFPATGHTLAFGFKTFWERSGGLPVFGYPLTEEFDQRNADTGQMYTVQYLERQRFEYHPEHKGTPYETLLGRLGAEDATRRNLTGTWAFQPLPAEQAPRTDCTYLPDVQHRLCGEFRPYWEGHGLDLGDPGVSFRESLALFGYPISEEFIDPDTGLVTQYFERAVFEYHPDNPLPYRVLLKRLAADGLNSVGW